MKKVFFAACVFAVCLAQGRDLVDFLYAAKPRVGSGRYFGSQSPLDDDSFQTCLELTEEANRPLIVLWSQSASGLDSLVATLNESYTANQSWGSGKNALFTIFYGSSRQAEKDAREFVVKHHGDPGSSGVCVCYGVCEDGYVVKSSAAVSAFATYKSTVDSFVRTFDSELKKHKYTPPKSSAAFLGGGHGLEATPETSSVQVPLVRTNDVGKAETDWIAATYPDGCVVTNAAAWTASAAYLELPVSMVTNGASVWVKGGNVMLELLNTNKVSIATNWIHFVENPAKGFVNPDLAGFSDWGEWTLDFAAATQEVYAANSYLQPDTNATANATVAVKTNVVIEVANVSNDLAFASADDLSAKIAEVSGGFDYRACASTTNVFDKAFEFELTNTVTTVYTNQVSTSVSAPVAFSATLTTTYKIQTGGPGTVTNQIPDLVSTNFNYTSTTDTSYALTNAEHAVAGETLVATNPVVMTEKDFVSTIVYTNVTDGTFETIACTNDLKFTVTNFTATVYTNAFSASAGTGTFEVKCAAPAWTNGVYIVWPGEGGACITNDTPETSSVQSAEFSFSATNETEYALADAEHASGTTVTRPDKTWTVSASVKGGATNVYYAVGARYVTAGETAVYGSLANEAFCVEMPGAATNAWTSWAGTDTESATSPYTESVAVTNYWNLYLAKEAASTQTDLSEKTSTTRELEFSRFYYNVVTNVYQYGAAGRAEGGRDESGIQSSALVVYGSTVWDANTVAFMQVATNDAFLALCDKYSLATVIAERSEPGTGASLLSYNIASNGNSGASYLSRRGLSANDFDVPEIDEDGFVVELVRPDGTVAGRLTPYVKNGVYSAVENVSRIEEMLKYALDDLTETENDRPGDTPLSLVYGGGQSETNTLHLSDRVDYFSVEGFPVDTPVKVTIDSNKRSGVTPNLALCRWTDAGEGLFEVLDKFAGLDDVWLIEDAGGLFLAVSAWEDDAVAATRAKDDSWFEYTISAGAAPENAGTLSFAPGEDGAADQDPDLPTGLLQPVEVLGTARVVISVERTGYTGEATATVTLVETNMPAGCFSWTCDANASTNLTWAENEYGTKSIYVDFTDVYWGEGVSNLVFVVEAAGAEPGAYTTYTVDVMQGVDDDWLTGSLSLTEPISNADIYVYAGDTVDVSVNRVAAWRDGVSVCSEARGEATALLSVGGGSLSTNEIIWSQYRTGVKTVRWTLPDDIGKALHKAYSVSLAGYDCDGRNMVDGVKSASVYVVPLWSKNFDEGKTVGSPLGVQYNDFYLEIPLANWTADSGIEILSLKTSGSLPAGLKASFDKAAGKLVISGVPTATTSNAVTFQFVLGNSDGNRALSFPVSVDFDVQALTDLNPGFASSRSWIGLPVVDSDAKHLAGLLDLTVSRNGRTSARYRKAGGTTVAFTSRGLSSIDSEGTAKIAAAKTTKGLEYSIDLTLDKDGALGATIVDPTLEGHVLAASVAAGAEGWSADNTAEAWGGLYSVSFLHDGDWHENTLCRGAPIIQIRFASQSQWRRGRATFAGTLPNGKTVSGTATFVPPGDGDTALKLPLLATSSSDTLSALLSVDGTVENDESVTSLWQHVEHRTSAASYENDYAACGRILGTNDWVSAWAESYGTTPVALFVDGEDTGARVVLGGSAVKVADKGSVSLGFQLNKTSGLAAGTFRGVRPGTDRTATFQWRAAAMPGLTPCAAGSCWYTTRATNDVGRARSVRAGEAVTFVTAE